ncbi:hypothetical protein AVEN_220987-1 [Araneus ventricosus]|uniref:Uncharacterized protein n=1 Tax=Araneus ventricosus TaxID=182803 RepID=A0A4Y2EPY7_ARAVE|nr:hypothetical protein AVEN_220987-1 [Araneus ventricosus]
MEIHGGSQPPVMMNSDRIPEIHKLLMRLRNVWFQHDGTPEHKTSSMKQFLVEELGEQVIGYGGFQEWPPRSPDLTPMDFFLCGYLKQLLYATPPPTLQDLQRRIRDACANVTPAMLHRVQRSSKGTDAHCN